jgi:hypothetical protein
LRIEIYTALKIKPVVVWVLYVVADVSEEPVASVIGVDVTTETAGFY